MGLIKGYLWTNDGKLTYNPAQDKDVSGMHANCLEIGIMTALPEQKGILVFMRGHVGVYIGNGEVIEAKGHAYGVVKTKLKDRPWESWGKLKWIEYEEEQEMELTYEEKIEAIKKYYEFGNGTLQYFSYYKWGEDLINRLYNKIPR